MTRKPKIFVIGAGGNIGSLVTRVFADNYDVTGAIHDYRPERISSPVKRLDITNQDDVYTAVDGLRPDLVVNTAAVAQTGLCRDNPRLAQAVNVDGAGNVARACDRTGARLISYSTDLVFDGAGGQYREDAPVNPLGQYALSKARSEKAVMENCRNCVIIRSAIAYGVGAGKRPNFFTFVIRQALKAQSARVFTDEFRSFFHEEDSARSALALAGSEETGIFHAGGGKRFSRYEFTRTMLEFMGLDSGILEPVKISDMPGHDSRPADCSMNSEKLETVTGWRPMDFEEGIAKFRQTLGL